MIFLEKEFFSTSRADGLAKSFGEFIRAKVVDVPTKFLERNCLG